MPDNTPDNLTTALAAAPRRGRTPIPEYTPPPLPEIPAEVEARLEAEARTMRTIDAAVDSIVDQAITLAEVTGQMQAFNYMNKVSGIGHIKLLAQIKAEKLYKGARVKTADGSFVTTTTFEDYCEAIGISPSKAYEDIKNLQLLGEEFLESAQRLGLGYRDMRRLRALPEDDRALIIEGEKVGNDPDALKDLLEELAAKRAKDRDIIKEAKADKDALEKVLATKNKTLDGAQTELAKLKNLTPDEQTTLIVERENNALRDLHTEGLKLLGGWGAYLARVAALVQTEDISPAALTMMTDLTSGICTTIADDLQTHSIDVDFRLTVYPVFFETPLRGDAPASAELEQAQRDLFEEQ